MATVRTADQLSAVIDEYLGYDEFVLDLETMYVPEPEEAEEFLRVSSKTAKQRTIDEEKWLGVYNLKATDPLVNTVIWVGLAGPGGSSAAIPVGHPKGRLLRPARRVKMPACEVYLDDDPRGRTKNGQPSTRAVLVNFPAEFAPPPKQLPIDYVIGELSPLLFRDALLIGQNIKFDIKTLVKYFGAWPTVRVGDIMHAQHLLEEKLISYQLEALLVRHFGSKYDKLGKKGVHNFSFGAASRYTAQDCRYEWLIWRHLRDRLKRIPSLWRFFNDYAIPFNDSLMRMEYEGVEVDKDVLNVLRGVKEKEIARIVDKLIVDYGAPRDFNPNAAVQVRELLYRKHRARVSTRTKVDQLPATDAKTLGHIAELTKVVTAEDGTKTQIVHPAAPVAGLLIEYAEQNKVLGTFLVGIPPRLDRNNRAHVDYLLHGTETSRVSCRNFNIQQIPRESEMRGAFLAPKGHVLVIGDYDQIELRKIAVESLDPALIGLFNSGQDVHRATAALVLQQLFEETDDEERQTYGKAQPLTSLVFTPYGWQKMGDIKVGDLVCDPASGQNVAVKGVYPQGVRPVYRLTFGDGSVVRADADHLWKVCQRGRSWLATTIELLDLLALASEPIYAPRVLPKGWVPLRSVEPDGFESTQCISVDSPHSLYITDDYIVTHNTPNFLVGYGGGAANLAEKTGIEEDHAQVVIDTWYKRFNRVQPWKDEEIRKARKRVRYDEFGRMTVAPYVETMLGRRRRLPDLVSQVKKIRMRAERQAVNAVVQGPASETALLGLVAVTDYQKTTGFPIKPVIEVHDEIVCTVPAHLADEAKVILADLMKGVIVPHTGEQPLKGLVPLQVKVILCDKWLK